MINFFRRIRKKLADDNQFLKYSRYAIGETVLVVFGILIALQINSWNEQRKLKKRFDLGMTEVYKNFLGHYYGSSTLNDRLELQLSYIDSILNGLEIKNPKHLPGILQLIDEIGMNKPIANSEWTKSLFVYNPYDDAQNEISKGFQFQFDAHAEAQQKLDWLQLSNKMISYLDQINVPVRDRPEGTSYSDFIKFYPEGFYGDEEILRIQDLLTDDSFVADLKSVKLNKQRMKMYIPTIVKTFESGLEYLKQQHPQAALEMKYMEIIGDATSIGHWGTGIQMNQDADNPNLWRLKVPLNDGWVKFRAFGGWEFDWGKSNLHKNRLIFKGGNIWVDAGTYLVEIDIKENRFSFEEVRGQN